MVNSMMAMPRDIRQEQKQACQELYKEDRAVYTRKSWEYQKRHKNMGKEQQVAGELQREMQVPSKGHELCVSGFLYGTG